MNPSDKLSKYRINKTQPSMMVEKESSNQQDPLEKYRIKKSETFPFIRETGRHAARISSRIAETIGGIPGDIESLIKSGIFAGMEKLTGHKASEEAHKEAEEKSQFPTTKKLKEFSEKATSGLTTPRNEQEKFVDEVASTAASLFGPLKFRKALGVSLASNLAKQGLKLGGLGEGSQEAGKLGTMFLATMYNPKGALKYATENFNKANELSKGASIAAPGLKSNIENLIFSLEKGVSTTEKNSVLKPAKELLEKVSKGKILVHDLTSAKRDINAIMGDPATLKGSKKLLQKLGKDVDKSLKPYEKINPKFSKAYRPANEIYGAVMQGNKAQNFLRKVLGPKSVLATVLGEVALGHPELVLPTAGAGLAIEGGARAVDFFFKNEK